MSQITSSTDSNTALDLCIESYPTVEEFFTLYNKIKKSRPFDKNTDGKKNPKVRSNPNIGTLRNKYNNLANIITGNIFFDVLEDQCELEVREMHWEYKVNDKSPFKDQVNLKLAELLKDAGSLENIPRYLLNILYQNDFEQFYSRFPLLEGTTLSIRLENGTDMGLYFCIPFTALKLGYLESFLESCDIIIPTYSHTPSNENTLKHSYEELESIAISYRQKANSVFERRYLP